MTEKNWVKKYHLDKILWMFLVGGFLGAIIETIFCRLVLGSWLNRSSLLYGQFSVVWAIGIVFLSLTLRNMAGKRDGYIFMAGTVLGALYEYLCSFVIEVMFGVKFWDYSHMSFNLHGRINLLFCFFWGIVALLWIKGIYPHLSKLVDHISNKLGKVCMWVLMVLICINMFFSAVAIMRTQERELGIVARTSFGHFIDEKYSTEYMMKRYPKMILGQPNK